MNNKFNQEPPKDIDQFIVNYAKQHINVKQNKITLFLRYAATIAILITVAFLLKPTDSVEHNQQQIVELTQPAVDSIIVEEYDEINSELLALELELSFSEEESMFLTNNM